MIKITFRILLLILFPLALFQNINPENSTSKTDEKFLSKSCNLNNINPHLIKNDIGVDGVKVVFCVEAYKKDVWKAITDYANFYNIFGNIKVNLINEDKNGATLQASLLYFKYKLYHHYIIPGEKYSWSRISGDLKIVSGSWSIFETDRQDLQIIEYESFLDAGNAFYNSLALYAFDDRAKETARKLQVYLKTNYPVKKAADHFN